MPFEENIQQLAWQLLVLQILIVLIRLMDLMMM
jgi:hypothetical protein